MRSVPLIKARLASPHKHTPPEHKHIQAHIHRPIHNYNQRMFLFVCLSMRNYIVTA